MHVLGDTHVYLNHVDALGEQLQREPRPFPRLLIKTARAELGEFRFEDLELEGYAPHGPIKMDMAV